MTHAAEAERAAVALQIALAHLGAATIEEAIILWNRMPARASAAQTETWLSAATAMIFSRRALGRDLAIAYYRLVRALRTGKTAPPQGERNPETITLASLRREFRLLAEGVLPAERPKPQEGQQELADYDWRNDGDDDLVIELDADAKDVLRQDTALEREIERATRESLRVLGPNNVERKNRRLDTSKPAVEIDEARRKAQASAGARQAAAAARIVKNAARGTLFQALTLDRAVIGWARVTGGLNPCGFCSMLASRGAVYKSAASALYDEGDLYHDNCNCFAIEIYSAEQYSSSALLAPTRDFEALWKRFLNSDFHGTSEGTSNDTLNDWRRFLDNHRRTTGSRGQPTTETAQEASA